MRIPIVATAALVVISCKTDVNVQQNANVEPTAQIVTPTDGAIFDESQTIEFVGTVGDGNGIGDIVSVVWTSDIDSEVGTSAPDDGGTVRMSARLSAGSHALTLTATDQDGAVAQDAITVHVQGQVQPPTAVIIAPSHNGTYLSTEPIDLVGEVGDLQQGPETLQISWAFYPANGGARTVIATDPADTTGDAFAVWSDATPGAWDVELEVTDQDGNSQTDQVSVIVQHPDDADLDNDGYPGATDCDDDDFDINPGRNESCDGIDNDCSGEIDDKDIDGDGFIALDCTLYTGLLPTGDCNDTNAFVYPGAFEQADNADNNCDGRMDEGTTLYDDDGDCDCESSTICNGSDNPICLTLGFSDCDDTDALMNNDDVDLDGASTCGGDCDDTDPTLNLSDWDGDLYTTCGGDCNDFDPLLIPSTCP